jgi:crotonobetainyl-CoA:carnitine CoA-transferase CaiB-like acyl-CoA transferase
MNRLLEGVRVLDLTNVLAGPFAGYQLALLGADVVKVENPDGGDLARQLGADPALNRAGMGASFLAQNAGKRSITRDLKAPAGKDVFRRLVAGADVVLENFRPGVMDRLGLGWEALTAIRPDLVYCAISGFGQTGPLRNNPAYDQIIQGFAGVMSVTGTEAGGPLRVGYPIADTIGGLTAAFAIAAALAGRARTGQGAFLDVAMLEATLVTMGWAVSNLLIAGVEPQRLGNDNMTASPSGAFRCADGLLNIAANKQEQFEALCGLIGRADLAADPRFAEREARKRNRAALTAEIEATLATDTAEAWEGRLNATGVPAGRVMTVPQILAHPQLAARDMIAAFPDAPGVGRDVRVVRSGFRVDGATPSPDGPPPVLGADTDAILREAGYDDAAIARLRAEGVA